MSSSNSNSKLLRKISMVNRPRPFRVVLLGQKGVGKSALTVRFLTRRFIGDYDPLWVQKVYTCTRCVDGETITFEILDTVGVEESPKLEEKIRWADAFLLIYSVTDRLSFDECVRLKLLITSYAKKNRRISLTSTADSWNTSYLPVILVGNKTDIAHDRMVSEENGRQRCCELNCLSFYEISVRESVEVCAEIFEDLFLYCKRPKKYKTSGNGSQIPRLPSSSDLESQDSTSPTSTTPKAYNRRRRGIAGTLGVDS
ncbi:ras-related and estrogen-regulated growth inhibitor-like [Liolophura sinensis]|uniref:ras-related and estrogen-regulated growth inhibitor-like n=1 Tax=Liolophura sinensis TaxID=3198878 RepID=UPI0031591B77